MKPIGSRGIGVSSGGRETLAVMDVSSKCHYAIRAMYALAEEAGRGGGPLKIAEIAERQRIPARFLEVILSQLKGGGFVRSRRGAEGGYALARGADQITVGEVMRYVDGPIAPMDHATTTPKSESATPEDCDFQAFWGRLRDAISDVVDRTTFDDLVRENEERRRGFVPDYTI